jgi:hypothetical protein
MKNTMLYNENDEGILGHFGTLKIFNNSCIIP